MSNNKQTSKMRANKVTDDEMDNLLSSAHFDTSAILSTEKADPVRPIGMVITLDEIETYDRNPRRAENAEYERLKSSLRETGSEGVVITITRRPGAERYMPDAGGNTRLRVLKELHAETGDDRYFRLETKYIPYRDESRILINHLVENEVRADYIFIDKAVGIRDVYKELSEEVGTELTQRDFIATLKSQGYDKVSLSLLGPINYAVDHLYQLIPQALDSGIGSPRVVQLKKIQTSYKAYWLAHKQKELDFDLKWSNTLKANDTWDGFSVDLIEEDVVEFVTSKIKEILVDYPAQINVETIRLEVSLFSKDPNSVTTLSTEPNYGWPIVNQDSQSNKPTARATYKAKEAPAAYVPPVPSASFAPSENRIEQLQAKCLREALKIAKEVGLKAVIKSLNSHNGFYCELPDSPLNRRKPIMAVTWWQLYAAAGLANADDLPDDSNLKAVLDQVEKASYLHTTLAKQQALITEQVPLYPVTWVQAQTKAEHQLSDKAYSAYISLLKVIRSIPKKEQ